jgi:hypothetical protein
MVSAPYSLYSIYLVINFSCYGAEREYFVGVQEQFVRVLHQVEYRCRCTDRASMQKELMSHKALPEKMHSFSQSSMLRLTQVRVALPQFACQITRQFDKGGIAQVGDL